jgi:tetratricopeptide (TPR) repeat protein
VESSDWDRTKLNPDITPLSLPPTSAIAFIGRDHELEKLDQLLQSKDRQAITAIQGMGGIGKTELALQYATKHRESYRGGICWLYARRQKIADQIVTFAKANLGIKPPDDMKETAEQVAFTWQRWPVGNTLIVIDDVIDYDAIAPYLPPSDPRFKVLITTRQNFGASVKPIKIQELSDKDAVNLLKSIAGDERIESQCSDAKALCHWVGNLPLGLELLGRFLVGKPPDWAIAKLLKEMESKRLAEEALIKCRSGMTATLGVAAALELSWIELSKQEQDLACLLGMFAVAPIPWNLVEQCFPEIDSDALEECRDEGLRDRSLLKPVDEGNYQLHQVVREFFRIKLHQRPDKGKELKEKFGRVMINTSAKIRDSLTVEQIKLLREVIIHIEETATQWIECVPKEDILELYQGIGLFYRNQSKHEIAEHWFSECVEKVKSSLGDSHIDYVSSLNNQAVCYIDQGRFIPAKPLFKEVSNKRRSKFGEDSIPYAYSLHNLAGCLNRLGESEKAERYIREAILIRKKHLGDNHQDCARSLNILADCLIQMGKAKDAEEHFREAISIWKEHLENNQLDYVSSLNGLALCLKMQGKYEEAMSSFQEVLEIRERFRGQEHPDYADSLTNIGLLHREKRDYMNAEKYLNKALKIRKEKLGKDHPDYLGSLDNLGDFYRFRKRYNDAIEIFSTVQEGYINIYGSKNHYTAGTLLNVGLVYSEKNNFPDAQRNFEEAIAMFEDCKRENHPDFAIALRALGQLYINFKKSENYQDAEKLFRRAIKVTKSINSTSPGACSMILEYCLDLGKLYCHQKRYRRVRVVYRKALELNDSLITFSYPPPKWVKNQLLILRLLRSLKIL